MKFLNSLFAVMLVVATASTASAGLGFFGSYVQMDANGTATDYNLTGAGGSLVDFDGLALGTFNPLGGDTLSISDAEGLTFKNGSSDVTGVNFNYSIALEGAGLSFTEQGLGFTSNAAPNFTDVAGNTFSSGGDQQWSNSAAWAPVNVLDGLADGDYELQVFLRGTSNEGDFFHSNSGSNYTATFSVSSVPEPTSLALVGLGIVGMLAPRKRS